MLFERDWIKNEWLISPIYRISISEAINYFDYNLISIYSPRLDIYYAL